MHAAREGAGGAGWSPLEKVGNHVTRDGLARMTSGQDLALISPLCNSSDSTPSHGELDKYLQPARDLPTGEGTSAEHSVQNTARTWALQTRHPVRARAGAHRACRLEVGVPSIQPTGAQSPPPAGTHPHPAQPGSCRLDQRPQRGRAPEHAQRPKPGGGGGPRLPLAVARQPSAAGDQPGVVLLPRAPVLRGTMETGGQSGGWLLPRSPAPGGGTGRRDRVMGCDRL